MDELIKKSFAKVKEDIFLLQSQISDIKRELNNLKKHSEPIEPTSSTQYPIPTHQEEKQTDNKHSTQNPTHNLPLYALKSPNTNISIGNEGVPTDRQQTDRQTDNSTRNEGVKFALIEKPSYRTSNLNNLEKVEELINSLDSIKKDLRTKVKRLTNQEMTVFSAIYELEEKGFIVDYSLVSQHLGLTESSIRDYVLRIVKKGLPVDKIKENNKKITLKISQELRKIAPLQTLHQLREI